MPIKKISPVNINAAGGSFSRTGLNGIYRARVESVGDPLGIGRVKVRIPKKHGGSEEDCNIQELDWAMPCFSSAGYNYGSYIVPEVGEYVFVGFEANDASKPVYFGSCYGSGSKEPKPYVSIDGSHEQSWKGEAGKKETPEESNGDPWYKIIYKTHEGHIIYMTDKKDKKEGRIRDSEGQYLQFSNAKDDIKIEMKDKDEQIIRFKDKKIEIESKEELDVKCGDVNIKLQKDGKKVKVTTGDTTINIEGGKVDISADVATVKVPVANVESSVLNVMSRAVVGVEAPAIVLTGAVEVVGSFVATA